MRNDGGKRQHGGAGRFVAGRFKAASCLVPAKRNWPRAGGLARRVAPPMVRREQLWLKAIVRARVGCGFTQAGKVVSSRSRWSEHGHAAGCRESFRTFNRVSTSSAAAMAPLLERRRAPAAPAACRYDGFSRSDRTALRISPGEEVLGKTRAAPAMAAAFPTIA